MRVKHQIVIRFARQFDLKIFHTCCLSPKRKTTENCPRERFATCGANFSFAPTCSLTVYFAIACFFHGVFCRQYVLPTVFLTTLYLTHSTFCRAPFCFTKENSVRQSALQAVFEKSTIRKNFPNKMLDNFSFENYIIIFDNKG